MSDQLADEREPVTHPQTPLSPPKVGRVDIRDVEKWKDPPKVSFDQLASLQMAKWVLWIFAGVYGACFILGLRVLWLKDVTHDIGVDLIKFMLTSVLPLVTLAVGYYLGDKSQSSEK